MLQIPNDQDEFTFALTHFLAHCCSLAAENVFGRQGKVKRHGHPLAFAEDLDHVIE
jgi:hypothetical protein